MLMQLLFLVNGKDLLDEEIPVKVLLSQQCVSQLLPKFPDLHRNVPANAGKPFNIYDHPLSMIRNRKPKNLKSEKS